MARSLNFSEMSPITVLLSVCQQQRLRGPEVGSCVTFGTEIGSVCTCLLFQIYLYN